MEAESFNDRYRLCRKHLELVEGGIEIRNLDMASRVASEIGGNASVSTSTTSRWRGTTVPDLATVGAIARVFGVNAGWLAYGKSGGPPPDFVTRPRASGRSVEEQA